MPNIDYDFIGFTFGDKHSYRDLKIYRTSDGSRYNVNLTAPIKDMATDVPGGDGQYLFDTKYAARQFSIPFAFDRLTEEEVTTLRQTFSGKEVKELIFDELPYKAYSAKVAGTPIIKVIPFTETSTDGTVNRIYRGEGTIQFTCHYPFAHTPTWYWQKQADGTYKASEKLKNNSDFDGRNPLHYIDNDDSIEGIKESAYPTYIEWKDCLGTLFGQTNEGELPAPFIASQESTKKIMEIRDIATIIRKDTDPSTINKPWFWDSRLGLVFVTSDDTIKGIKIPIPYYGNACATIPVDCQIDGLYESLDFQYWYY